MSIPFACSAGVSAAVEGREYRSEKIQQLYRARGQFQEDDVGLEIVEGFLPTQLYAACLAWS